MYIYNSTVSDPYFNLATEEYLLKNSQEEFMMLYFNDPCVVVGKHQIVPKEIDQKFAMENQIRIARRISGGGTVFHDQGNLNFSFIKDHLPGTSISYQSITQPIFKFLIASGWDVYWSDRNDLMLNGKKISGSAMHIFKDRILAHGTLLINSNLTHLSNALKSHADRYHDKSIRSLKSNVTNLYESTENIDPTRIMHDLSGFVHLEHKHAAANFHIDQHYQHIQQLAASKYSSPAWIYGYAPKYSYTHTLENVLPAVTITLTVEKGIIESMQIESGDESTLTTLLEYNSLIGMPHNYMALYNYFNSLDLNDTEMKNLLSVLF